MSLPRSYIWTRAALVALVGATVVTLSVLALRAGLPAELLSHGKAALQALRSWWTR